MPAYPKDSRVGREMPEMRKPDKGSAPIGGAPAQGKPPGMRAFDDAIVASIRGLKNLSGDDPTVADIATDLNADLRSVMAACTRMVAEKRLKRSK